MSEHETEKTELSCVVATSIHQGKRTRQEDAIGYWENREGHYSFAVVADGAGGHGGGAEASASVVSEAERCWAEFGRDADIRDFMERWFLQAHAGIKKGAKENGSDGRSVAVGLLISGREATWVHAGDCRLYHFRGWDLQARTRDDSVVQILLEQGEITEDEMGNHPDQNRLLQALGGDEPPTPRWGTAVIEPGDVFLLCSDGFWENLKPEELEGLAASDQRTWKRGLNSWVKTAVKRGGPEADNTSVVMIGVNDARGKNSNHLRIFKVLFFAILVIASVFIGIVLASFLKDRLNDDSSSLKPDSPSAVAIQKGLSSSIKSDEGEEGNSADTQGQ